METQFVIAIVTTAALGTLGGIILARLFDLHDDPRETRRRRRRERRQKRRENLRTVPLNPKRRRDRYVQ